MQVSPARSLFRRAQPAVGLLPAALITCLGGCDVIDVIILPDGGVTIGRRGADAGPASDAGNVGGSRGGGGGSPPVPLPGPPVSVPTTACQRELIERGVEFSVAAHQNAHPAGRPDLTCVVDDPVMVRPVLRGVTFRPARIGAAPVPLFAACALAASMDKMSQVLAERGVSDVIYFAIYGCRVVAGSSNLSEHARARALDLAGLRLANGNTHLVLSDWEKHQPAPVTAGGQLLRRVATSLYDADIFHIILTPDYNADHANHLHMDLTPDGRLFK